MMDDAELAEAELSIFDDLCAGDASTLAAYLRAGNVPSRALGIELADMIEHGEFVAVRRDPSQAQRNRQVRARRDLEIGAWVWVRRFHVRGATLEAIETEAVSPDGINHSRATVHRAYLKFKKLMENGDEFDLVQARWALDHALKQLCKDAGFDFHEQFLRLYSVHNLDLEIALRK
jgi:hypothetical protein